MAGRRADILRRIAEVEQEAEKYFQKAEGLERRLQAYVESQVGPPGRGAGAWKNAAGDVCFLARPRAGVKVIEEVAAPCPSSQPKVPTAECHFAKCAQWGKSHEERDSQIQGLERQMGNKVRKCGKCGKPNAFTLVTCNSCGADLPKETTTTPNVFMCFVYGFEGLKLSLRYQDKNMMVLDDMLSLSSAHFNALWARDWIPDFRWLLARPTEGLEVLQTMYDKCHEALREQFVGGQLEFYSTVNNGTIPLDEMVIAGMNFPPSQFQLHLQFITLPLLPFQYAQYLKNVHFTKGRFFPVQYVLDALTKLKAEGKCLKIEEDTPAEKVMDALATFGISYDDHWDLVNKSVEERQVKAGNWDPERFEKVALGDRLYDFTVDGGTVKPEGQGEPAEVSKQVDADKATLQNYGRPYSDGKPDARSWYSFAKSPGEVKRFDEAFPVGTYQQIDL
eukprot:Hpha_TRINITY_DN35591_c0_g1::TRINITY_DN35591_c0_g1_i1::g.84563::m.84563